MTKKLASLATIAAVAVIGLVFSGHRVGGQQSPQTQVYPDVWQEIAHDTAGPMSQLGRRAPKGGPAHSLNWLKREHKAQHGPADSVVQSSSGPLVGTTGLLNFGGVGANGFAPPDTNGAVGATQYVQWVNVEYAVYNKSNGALVQGPFAGNSFWAGFADSQCANNNSGDPVAQYDKAANRWVMVQPVFTSPYRMCFAVSTTSDATGTYNRYSFSMPNFPDYPKIAVWSDAYYGSFNLFQGNSFVGAYACAFDRNAMLNGTAATAQCFTNNSEFSFMPSDLDGSTAPPAGSSDYFIDLGSLNTLDEYAFHVDFANPANSTFTGPTLITTAGFNEACGGGTCIPQKGTNQVLDSLGDRLMYRLAYRNFGDHESLVVSHSVDNGSGVSGVRWYEIRSPGSNPTVHQQGTFSPDSTYRWMPSIAMDKAGDIAVGYSASSSSVFPSIRYTGRVPTDALGTLETENTILTGTAAQTNGLNRWGDYSAMSVDPGDDCTFYYTNEYLPFNGSFNWATQIASFKFPNCGSTTPDFSVAVSPSSQTVVQGNGTSYNVTVTALNGFTGTVNLSVSGFGAGASGILSPPSVTFPGSGASTLSVTTMAGAQTGAFTLTVTGTSGTLNHSATTTLNVNPPPDFTISATPSSRTVTQGNGTTYTVSIGALNGFNGAVSFGASGLGSGASASFSPTTVTGSGSTTMTVSTTAVAVTGTFTVMITGNSSPLSHSTSVTFVVNPAPQPDFSISASPGSQTVQVGSGTSYNVSVSALNGFSGSVGFSASGLPTGANATFNPTSVTGSGSSTMSVTTSGSTSTGSYTVTVTGKSGALVHSTTVTLVVSNANFSLTASPGSQTVRHGSSTSYTVTVTGSGGFAGTVSFSVSGLPSRSNASFSPTTVTGSGSTTMTVSTNRKTTTGTRTLTITGTSGSLVKSTNVTLVVN